MKRNAIGVLETSYFANTVVVVDQALKAAPVEIVSCHKRLGGRMCHTVLAGETAGVEAAMEAARDAKRIVGEKNVKVAVTISNPHPEVLKLLNMIDAHEERAERGPQKAEEKAEEAGNPPPQKKDKQSGAKAGAGSRRRRIPVNKREE